MPEKIKKIKVYVENKGRGKATIVDSNISVQDFPAKNSDGKKSVGIYAIEVEMPESNLKAFKGMAEVHYPHQLNVLSETKFKELRTKEVVEAEEKKRSSEKEVERLKEIQLYEAAMKGADTEVLAYLEKYPDMKDEHGDNVRERTVYLDVKTKNTKKAYDEFLNKHPKSKYSEEIKTLMNKAK